MEAKMAIQKSIKMIADWNVGGTPRKEGETVVCSAVDAQIAVAHGKAEFVAPTKVKNAPSKA
jgi:hypothetical protein